MNASDATPQANPAPEAKPAPFMTVKEFRKQVCGIVMDFFHETDGRSIPCFCGDDGLPETRPMSEARELLDKLSRTLLDEPFAERESR